MTAERKKLAKRFVKCERWRWMPGMKALYTGDQCHRVTMADAYGVPAIIRPPHARWAWPDLTDPATLGCILALVRRAYDQSDVYVTPYRKPFGPEQWICWRLKNDTSSAVGRGSSEAEALLLALEAA